MAGMLSSGFCSREDQRDSDAAARVTMAADRGVTAARVRVGVRGWGRASEKARL